MYKSPETFFSFALALVLSSCAAANTRSDVNETQVLPLLTTATEPFDPTSFQPVETEIVSSPAPNWDNLWFPTYPGDLAWILEEDGPYTFTMPFYVGKFFDYSPVNHSMLMALDFPDRGAGPGFMAVSDLTISNLDTAQIDTLFTDNIVEALWFPDGESFAYILATDQTYELHWRSTYGVDRVLARDVTFTWSIAPSGRAVAFTRETGFELDIEPGLFVVDLDSGEEKLIADVDKQGSGNILDQPYWSPDSQEVILSHWGGPHEPRLILAMANGSGAFDLSLDEALTDEWWATIALTYILWDVDGNHLLTLADETSSDMDGLCPLVYYRLNRDTRSLTEGELLAQVPVMIGWAVPGDSVWVYSFGGEVTQIELP